MKEALSKHSEDCQSNPANEDLAMSLKHFEHYVFILGTISFFFPLYDFLLSSLKPKVFLKRRNAIGRWWYRKIWLTWPTC